MAKHTDTQSGGYDHRKQPSAKRLEHIKIYSKLGGGHDVQHHFHYDGGMDENRPEHHEFGAAQGNKMMEHLAKHVGIKHSLKAAESEED